MKFLKRKYSGKPVLFASAVLLLVSVIVVFLLHINDISNSITSVELSFSATPTPYPLPTLVNDSPSYLTTIIGQVFRKKEQIIAPFSITENSKPQAENEYLNLYSENGHIPVNVQWWQEESKQVYEYVSKRIDTTITEKVIVIFVAPQSRNCASRGITFHDKQPVIMIFANEDTSEKQILATLAHELGHVFIHKKYKDLSDNTLIEGMANWAAGNYWEDWKGADFNSAVRAFVTDGVYLPLYQNYYLEKAYDAGSPDCIVHRDILLTEVASFLDFLIQNYGTDALSLLFETKPPELVDGRRITYPSDFKDVFGLEFNQLEYEWLKALLEPSP